MFPMKYGGRGDNACLRFLESLRRDAFVSRGVLVVPRKNRRLSAFFPSAMTAQPIEFFLVIIHDPR